ncbi:MAG TPA: PfkB family carbohydrate kinase, partial [Vicinamibacteria bacterium]
MTGGASYDLVALGETMLALAPPAGQALAEAGSLLVDHAGAESNTCVGLARLGFRVAWVSRLGADPAGDRVLRALQTEGVDTRFVHRDPERPTGLLLKDRAAGVRYYRAGSAASVLAPEDLAGVPVSEARAALVTGVTALIGRGPQAAARAFLAAARGLRVLDPNLRRGLWGSDRRAELVRELAAEVDLLLGGHEELVEVFGATAGEEGARALAQRCAG